MPELPPELLAIIADADPTAVPPPVESTGPDDPEPVDQDPGFEEADVPDADADTTLADPAVQED